MTVSVNAPAFQAWKNVNPQKIARVVEQLKGEAELFSVSVPTVGSSVENLTKVVTTPATFWEGAKTDWFHAGTRVTEQPKTLRFGLVADDVIELTGVPRTITGPEDLRKLQDFADTWSQKNNKPLAIVQARDGNIGVTLGYAAVQPGSIRRDVPVVDYDVVLRRKNLSHVRTGRELSSSDIAPHDFSRLKNELGPGWLYDLKDRTTPSWVSAPPVERLDLAFAKGTDAHKSGFRSIYLPSAETPGAVIQHLQPSFPADTKRKLEWADSYAGIVALSGEGQGMARIDQRSSGAPGLIAKVAHQIDGAA